MYSTTISRSRVRKRKCLYKSHECPSHVLSHGHVPLDIENKGQCIVRDSNGAQASTEAWWVSSSKSKVIVSSPWCGTKSSILKNPRLALVISLLLCAFR